jgi:hypothetical protein
MKEADAFRTVIATAVMHPYFLPCRSFDKQFVFMA